MSVNQQPLANKSHYLQVELPNIYIDASYRVYLWNSQKRSMIPIGYIDQQGIVHCQFQLPVVVGTSVDTLEFGTHLIYQPSNASYE